MTLKISLLPRRGVLRLEGEDRGAFLQGLISNDIALCQPAQPLYAALLTPQGKFLHDLFIFDDDGAFLIDCESDRADDLMKRLRMYKLRAKITLEDARTTHKILAAWGDGLAPDGFLPDPRLPALGWRAILPDTALPAQTATEDDYDAHRLALGVPDGSRDMLIEKSTLLECNMDRLRAISWTKGCYMGQELTARMHYRGLVKKRLYPVSIEGTLPDAGMAVMNGDEDIGDMRSACGNTGMALLNIEKAGAAMQSKTPLTCSGAKLVPFMPDWLA